MRISPLVFVAFAILASLAGRAEAEFSFWTATGDDITCNGSDPQYFDPYVVIHGRLTDLARVVTKFPSGLQVYDASAETRAQMNIVSEGKIRRNFGPLWFECSDVQYLGESFVESVSGAEFIRPTIIYIRTGKENDLLQLYGVSYREVSNSLVVVESLSQLVWNPHDGELKLRAHGLAENGESYFLDIVNGLQGDLRNRFCWRPGVGWQMSSKNRTGAFEGCDRTVNGEFNASQKIIDFKKDMKCLGLNDESDECKLYRCEGYPITKTFNSKNYSYTEKCPYSCSRGIITKASQEFCQRTCNGVIMSGDETCSSLGPINPRTGMPRSPEIFESFDIDSN